MSVDWAERQRHTNRLTRALANHLFSQKTVTARQLYGLSKLAWITNSYEGDSAAYIASTKIPALSDVVGADYTNSSLKQVAKSISRQYGDASLVDLVVGHSGFTNFYKAYRNSVLLWIEANIVKLAPLYREAYAANSEEEKLKIVKSIAGLPGIPKANHPPPVSGMLSPQNEGDEVSRMSPGSAKSCRGSLCLSEGLEDLRRAPSEEGDLSHI